MSGPDEPREPEGYDDAPPFRPARRPPLLHRKVPVAREVPHYRLATVRLDLVAALTVAALAVPAAMAYAELAGLTPVAGVDSAGLDAIAGVATSLSREGIVRHVARMKTPVYERLEGAEVADVIGPERFHPTVRAAVRAAASRTVVPAASV